MHRVVSSHLTDFQALHQIDGDESKQFEALVNYAIFKNFSAEHIDPKQLVYEGDDPGIDGIMIFIDDSYVSTPEEVEEEFKARKKDAVVHVCFVQSKTSEAWKKSEINTFESAVKDFLGEENAYPANDGIKNAKEVFDAILVNVGKIKDGKPQASAYFVTTARSADNREILAAGSALKATINDTGLFSEVHSILGDRDSIVKLWKAAEGRVESKLKILGSAAFPKAPGIEEVYVVTVKAKDFIDQILTDDNGRLRQSIFEENVRDYIGAHGDVNSEMAETLCDPIKQKRFGILNNGITIISPDIRITGFEIFLSDFQIVNGCQTSNVLFENRANIDDEVTVMLKVVETSEAFVVDDIVRSTNRQTKVEEEQFLATLDAVKAIEHYFNARGADEEYQLFFERRKNQFSNHEDAKPIRVFDIKEIARCVAAMFLDRPDIASRYPNRLTGELKSAVFSKRYNEEVYHTAAYTLYRLKLLIGNRRIDTRYGKLRWHILMALRYFICGDAPLDPGSAKVKKACLDLEKFVSGNDEETVSKLRQLCSEVVDIEEINRDKLKANSLVPDVKARALAARKRVFDKS